MNLLSEVAVLSNKIYKFAVALKHFTMDISHRLKVMFHKTANNLAIDMNDLIVNSATPNDLSPWK